MLAIKEIKLGISMLYNMILEQFQLMLIILLKTDEKFEKFYENAVISGKFQPRDKNPSRGNSFIMIDVYFIYCVGQSRQIRRSN